MELGRCMCVGSCSFIYGWMCDLANNSINIKENYSTKAPRKEKKQPVPDSFTIRKNLIEQQLQQSGSSNAPKAKDNDLLKAADAIVGAK